MYRANGRIKTSAKNAMEVLVDGQWWKVVEYKEVNSGIRCFFEDKTTTVIPHAEANDRIKVTSAGTTYIV